MLLGLDSELLDLVMGAELLIRHVGEGVDALLVGDTRLRVVLDDAVHRGLKVVQASELVSSRVRGLLANGSLVGAPHVHEDGVVNGLLTVEVSFEVFVHVGGGGADKSSDSGERLKH